MELKNICRPGLAHATRGCQEAKMDTIEIDQRLERIEQLLGLVLAALERKPAQNPDRAADQYFIEISPYGHAFADDRGVIRSGAITARPVGR